MGINLDKRNYRKHSDKNKKLINKSLKECGAGRSIVIDNEDNIIAGNGIYEQAQKLGLKTKIVETDGSELVVVKRTDLATEDEKRKQLAIMDNSTSDSSEFDYELLQLDFNIETLDNWGIERLEIIEEQKEITEDEIPENVDTRCKLGDIWKLGNHRLLCGDSTNITDVEKLMNGNKADITFCSPPYNIGKNNIDVFQNGKSAKYTNNMDDKPPEEYLQFLCDFTTNSLNFSDFSFINIQSLSNNKITIIDYLYKMKPYFADTIIWDKITGTPSGLNKNILNSVFEYIHVFSNKGTRQIGVKEFHGNLSNIIHISKQTKNEYSKIHNATFPLELATYFVDNFSLNSVLDLFGGTGTTLIACEHLNRKCFMMELDPYYCDVIITRWENLTGQKALLVKE